MDNKQPPCSCRGLLTTCMHVLVRLRFKLSPLPTCYPSAVTKQRRWTARPSRTQVWNPSNRKRNSHKCLLVNLAQKGLKTAVAWSWFLTFNIDWLTITLVLNLHLHAVLFLCNASCISVCATGAAVAQVAVNVVTRRLVQSLSALSYFQCIQCIFLCISVISVGTLSYSTGV